jgi:hypothetical protein
MKELTPEQLDEVTAGNVSSVITGAFKPPTPPRL